MKRALAIVVACSLAAGVSGQARQQPQATSVVVENVEGGSAADLAGIKVGDELVSFRTPFDARHFELERLPRGGAEVNILRSGSPRVVKLIPGYWGVTVRPGPESDPGNAAWRLTRTGSELAARDQIDQADATFTEAIDLCRRSSNLALEAMVWEAKGRAYLPENTPAGSASPVTKARLEAALAAHQRALAIRQQLGQVLASAESQLLSGFVVRWGVQGQKLPYATAEDKEAFARSGNGIQEALDVIAKEAPDSFAHARALVAMSSHIAVSGQPLQVKGMPAEQVAAIREKRYPFLRRARPILERVAPTHDLLQSTLQTLYFNSFGRTGKEADAEAEDLAREWIRFGERKSDRTVLEFATQNLGSVLSRRGDFDGAVALIDGLVKTGSAPGSLINFVADVAITAHNQGALDEAISLLERHLKLIDLTPAQGIKLPYLLADYYSERGDWAAAERTLAPWISKIDDPAIKYSQRRDFFFQLANFAAARGDSGLAEIYATRALKEADQGPTLVGIKQNFLEFLSILADQRGDRETALKLMRQSIALGEAENPPNEWNQVLLKIQLAGLSGDPAAVNALTEQKLALARRLQPGGQKEADALYDAGLVKIQQGQDAAALPYLHEALPMIRRLEPGTMSVVKTLSLLGMAEGATNGWQAGMVYHDQAMDLLDDRRMRASDDGARALMRGEFTDVYVNAVALLVKGRQYERAFAVVERSRARALLNMLATRDLRGTAVPAALRRRQRQLESQHDAIQQQLADMTMADGEAIAKAQVALDKVSLDLNEVDRQVSQIDPAAAARLRPAPLTLAQVRARLDPGTVLLSYMSTWDSTYLFVVTPFASGGDRNEGLSVYTLPVSESDLRQSVGAFTTLIDWDRDPQTARRADLIARARGLYDTLVRPAEAQVRVADRVLLNLDGPLLSLEFSALVRNQTGPPTYFAEWKPIHRTPSMAVYAQILESRRPTGPPVLVAFADPVYAKGPALPVDAMESLVRSGTALTPLPGARLEARAIVDLFKPNALLFVGDAATESRARAIDRTTRFIHFAVHGFFNDQRPLDSGLVLAMPGTARAADGNGLLQAWEIFDHVRLNADLVTLSACESGLAGGTAGEGLVGLTSAFLYAGARSVVASHWRVADGPTAELMKLFYTNLKKGQTKDQALQNAQRELIRMGRQPGGVDYSSPAYWAAFALTGDWK